MEEKGPGLSKYSKEGEFSRDIKENTVKFSREYFRKDDPH
jgi:hypothetical protein